MERHPNPHFSGVMIGGVTVSIHLSKYRTFVAARVFRTVAMAVLVALGAACAPGHNADQKPHDIVIVTVDTARAEERFSFAGPSPVTTAATDRVASEGAVFLSAVAPSPITLVSHVSLFTGQDPITHGNHG